MIAAAGRLFLSATDLSNHLACPHLSLLGRRAALGGKQPPRYDDPALALLWERGRLHEQAYLDALKADPAQRIVEIEQPDRTLPHLEYWSRLGAATLDAMQSGADVIVQAGLCDGTWVGRADFLRRVPRPGSLGDWSYEVVDTKLAREAKGGALLQVLLYADLLEPLQGIAPEFVHIALGGPAPTTASFRVADYAAYFRSMKRRFLAAMRDMTTAEPTVPEPVPHCRICAWSATCDEERRNVDHLSFVAGIGRNQRRALGDRGIGTLSALARLPLPAQPRIDSITGAALMRIREQARIQLAGSTAGRNVHELLLPVVPGQGLAALPEPSPGDIFFDLEGDPYAFGDGIEYLFGFTDRAGVYTGWWSFDREGERRAFEQFIDFIMQRLDEYPDLHIYHYAAYETTAVRKLMGRYATRELEVDRLLRGRVFIDLHRVVRQGLRASVESYSIKKLEPFYGYRRTVDLRDARSALAHFEAWLELGGDSDAGDLVQRIQGYNRDDVLSTLRLHGWLENLRDQLAVQSGEPVPRPAPQSADPPDTVQQRDEAMAALVTRLTVGVPADETLRSPEQHARWMLAQLLEFHRREMKSSWWEFHRCMDLGHDERIEDRATLGGLEYVGPVDVVKKSVVHQYRFPPQEHGLRAGARTVDPETQSSAGEIIEIDDAAHTISLKRGSTSRVPHPRALIEKDMVSDTVLRDSLVRSAEAIAGSGFTDDRSRCIADLLLRHPPRVGAPDGSRLLRERESTVNAAVRLGLALDRSVLPIQGPPGSGKTYTAARMVVHLLQAGLRVGVTAPSHKVIGNLLDEVCRAADELRVTVAGVQKATEEQGCTAPRIRRTADNADVVQAITSGAANLAAGTAWLWSRPDMAGTVDVLVVDEAGQFSLANAVAVAPAAASLVLVGDPQQLEQPSRGTHPPGVKVSALDYLLAGHDTVEAERGLFLDRTWRLHPDICAFTSEIFYSGRLESRAGMERQMVRGPAPLNGTGLRFLSVRHSGNSSESPEEVAVIRALFDAALSGHATWIDARGAETPIRLDDMLVVAPYNAQVDALRRALPPAARVGTVDRFQGQEAPIVIYSMASSTAEDAPRGMSFLYEPNRLNVATSRARCLAVIVGSPLIFVPECRTPEQMRLANAFCRFAELAQDADSAEE